jgi:hypothetical protein
VAAEFIFRNRQPVDDFEGPIKVQGAKCQVSGNSALRFHRHFAPRAGHFFT